MNIMRLGGHHAPLQNVNLHIFYGGEYRIRGMYKGPVDAEVQYRQILG